jgi:pimeloyl-ACP methyl ester carboxylesterase
VISEIQSEEQCRQIDALAVSLACEFLAKVALRRPDEIRSLALVSPTGFARDTATHGPPEADCRRPGVLRVLDLPLLGKGLFRLLTSRASIRFFLQRTWGSKQIDEQLFEDSCRVCRAVGAQRAPFHFIAGYLFSADIPSVFEALEQPVWLAHGVRGVFADFSRAARFSDKPNWQVTTFETGAMPHFEVRDAFIEEYRAFLQRAGERRPNRPTADDDS